MCRIVVETTPHAGAWNMAVDEALLEAAVDRGALQARWYRWSEATLSLGYFQPVPSAGHSPRLSGLPVVRRLSGGGAILHHHEWTYSCAIPASHPLARSPRDLYTVVHDEIIRALARFGIQTRQRGVTDPGRDSQFLCFGRADAADVVAGDQKVLGSAQRRRKGAILQHGSLVLRRSEFAPEFPGIFDLSPQPVAIDSDAFLGPLSDALRQALGIESRGPAIRDEISETDRRRAAELAQTRYASPER
jgi:lipoate-protein ligase A